MDNLVRRVTDYFQSPTSPAVQVLSDLHLELCTQYTTYSFPCTAPFLLLAGDIGRLVDYEHFLTFLAAQTSQFERVFLVLGNHEFYEMSYEKAIAEAERLQREEKLAGKLTVLHRKRWDDEGGGLTIVGCTLWNRITEESRGAVTLRVNDYNKIQGWSVEKCNELHEEEVKWLREQIAALREEATHTSAPGSDGLSSRRKRRVLVVTHHAPVVQGTSKPEHLSNPWAPAFATDLLTQKKDWEGVSSWVFGHTHFTTDFLKNGVRVVANQRGYVFPNEKKRKPREGEKQYKEFDDSFAISV